MGFLWGYFSGFLSWFFKNKNPGWVGLNYNNPGGYEVGEVVGLNYNNPGSYEVGEVGK